MRPALAPAADPAPARFSAQVSVLAAARVAALLMSLAGCAVRPVAVPPVTRPAPPVATAPVAAPPESAPSGTPVGTQIGTTASGGSITVHQSPVPAPVSAVVDSTPSADALAVLRTIPEPLGASGVPDSVRVPVPAPTQPLGDRPGTRAIAALPESLAAPVLPPPSGSFPAASPVTATVRADSCWRVQVAAPPERERAERMTEVARSQLLLPFVIEREGGLFKVRSRDCLTAGVANDLRRRAVESGFAGAFRFQVKPR